MLEPEAAPWRVRDFILAMSGGVLLALLVAIPTIDASPTVFLVSAAVAQYAGHFGTIWFLARRRGGFASLGFQVEGRDGLWLLAGIALQVILPVLFFPLAEMISEGDGGQVIGEELRALNNDGARIYMALTIGLLAPVTEELLFRGILLRAILPQRARSAAWIVAAVFALFHIFGLGGDLLRALVMTMPVFFVMGLILANLTIRRGRLGPAIFVHAGFNLLGLLVLFLPEEVIDEALRQATTTSLGG